MTKKLSIGRTFIASGVLLAALGCGAKVDAGDVGSIQNETRDAQRNWARDAGGGDIGSLRNGTRNVGTVAGLNETSRQVATQASISKPIAEPLVERYSGVPKDPRLKEVYDDLVQFRSDLALRHLGPIVRAKAKKGFRTARERLVMARLMVLVGYAYLIDENFLAGFNSIRIAYKLSPDDVQTKCMLVPLLRELPDFKAEDGICAGLVDTPKKESFSNLYLTLARHARRDGDLELATKYYNQADALDTGKRNGILQQSYARMLVQSGLNQSAVKRFKLAAERTENKYLSEIMLANADLIQFDDAAYEQHLHAASKAYPDDPIWRLKLSDFYIQKGNEKSGLPLIQEALRCRRFSSGAYLKIARHYLTKKRFDQALDAVHQLERRSRVTEATISMKGEIEAGRGNKAKAEEYYKQALGLNPKNAGVYELLAELYTIAPNRETDLVKITSQYVSELPKSWTAHFSSAQALLRAKQLVEAEEEAKKTLKLLSVYPEQDLNLYAKHRVGVVHSIIGTKYYVVDKDFERAAAEAKAFNQMKFNPDLPAYLKIVSLRPERLVFKDLLGLNDPMLHVALADMLMESHMLDLSIEEYKRAQELAPDDQAVRSYLIHAYSQKGDWGAAASQNFAFSQTLVNQIPGAIDELSNGKKKQTPKSEAKPSGVNKTGTKTEPSGVKVPAAKLNSSGSAATDSGETLDANHASKNGSETQARESNTRSK